MNQPLKIAAEKINSFIKKPDGLRFALIVSPDKVRRERAFMQLIKGVLPQSVKEGRLDPLFATRLHYTSISVDSLNQRMEDLRSPMIFQDQGVLVIDSLDRLNSSTLSIVLELCKLSSAQMRVFLLSSSILKNTLLCKYAEKEGVLIEIPSLENEELVKWTYKELQNNEVSLPENKQEIKGLIDSIILIAGSSADNINQIVEHLGIFLDGQILKEQVIKELFPHRDRAKEYQLMEAINNKNISDMDVLLRTLMAQGVSPFVIVAIVQKNLTQMIALRSAAQTPTDRQRVLKILGIPSWIGDKQRNSATKYSLSEMISANSHLLTLDSRLKNYSLGDYMNLGDTLGRLAIRGGLSDDK